MFELKIKLVNVQFMPLVCLETSSNLLDYLNKIIFDCFLPLSYLMLQRYNYCCSYFYPNLDRFKLIHA